MALGSGVESWGSGSQRLAQLAFGLAIVTLGGATWDDLGPWLG